METNLSEFKKNIVLWYPFKENSSVLNLNKEFEDIFKNLNVKFNRIVSVDFQDIYSNDSNIILNKNLNEENSNIIAELNENDKFDYVVLIGKYTFDFSEKLEFAKKHLNDDGKILIAIDNQFGLKNLNSSDDLRYGISQNNLQDLFDKNNLKHSNFYYVFPNYYDANLIYSEDYQITEEDITRNFSIYLENSAVPLNENEVYRKLLKEGNKQLNQFANAFFVEVSKKTIDNDIKYVTFSNYRKPEYRTMTIIKKDIVIKKAADEKANEHIEKIIKNLEELEKLNVVVIEKNDNRELISNFIHSKRFDEELSESDSIEIFMDKFKILKDVLEKNSFSYEEFLKQFDSKDPKKVFRDTICNYDEDKLKNMHFLKKAFIDLVPKNCFLVDGRLHVFDQEWIEENVPLEYIYYRVTLNTIQALRKFGKEELLKEFGIFEYVDLFEKLENELRERTCDEEKINLFFRAYINLEKAERQRSIFREKSFSLQERVDYLEEENHGLNLELEDAREKLVDYANQLRVISNSSSWKIIQKIRSIIGFFNFRNGINLIDKIYPVGTKRREKYEKKQAEKREEKRIKNMKKSTDEETVEYWLELEKQYKTRRKELDEAVLESDSDPYLFWSKINDPTELELQEQKNISENFEFKPKISILVPLYNTPVVFFRELLFTLYHQTYSNWELCLADGSEEKLVEIEKMCKDSRIKYHFIGENKGISGNTNEALKFATGDYIALLDHDDLLPLNALFEIVNCIQKNPDVEFIYTDEDKIESIDKPRYDPHFKPDYAPDFLMSGNYICHFSVFKKELMDKLEGFKSDYDGAQDFDIILRATELAGKEKICHIPKILYHWRIHPGSTAGDSDAKSYAHLAGEKAVQDHLKRIGSNGIVKRDDNVNGFYKVTYPVIGNPKVNILIINRNDVNYLKKCIESILNITTYSNYEIDIIDNASEDFETLKYYKELEKSKNIKIFKYLGEKVNNSKLINFASKYIDGEFIAEIDRHEIISTNNWLEIMIGIAQRKEVGCVGSKVYYADGTIKHAGIGYGINDFAAYLYRGTYNGHRVRDRMICNMSCISSLCRMYRKELFEKINGMNENIEFETINEVDFSFRLLEKGYLNIYTPQVELNDNDIFNERERIEEEDIFEYRKEIKELKSSWHDLFEKSDPYLNINFSPASSNCVLRIDKV